MGAKAWFIAYFDDDPRKILAAHPELDRGASLKLAQDLFPLSELKPGPDSNLAFLNPPDDQVFVAHYPGLQIVAHGDLGIDYPSAIGPRWLEPALGRSAYVHATHSVVDWLAFALWQDGQLVRALGLSPDSGVQENIGTPLAFEAPYWDGQHPVPTIDQGDDPYPLPFHPLDLSEESMLHHLGFQFEGGLDDWVCEPEDMPIATFSIAKKRSRWKFW